MTLTAGKLANLVYADHVAAFPDAAGVLVPHETLGPFNPSSELVSALCAGLVDTVLSLPINGSYGGFAGDGTAAPLPIILSEAAIQSAVSGFVAANEWTGPYSVEVADSLVGNPLRRLPSVCLLQMKATSFVGTASVSPAENPSLAAHAETMLMATLSAAFEAAGYFGNPVNSYLSAQVAFYASAYSAVLAGMTASPVYVGVPEATTVEGSILGAIL